jgi:lipopolysaccharide export system ATP-binding protein
MKILSGSLKAGFCSMRIDGKWHRRFTEKEIRYLPQHPFIPGWLRLERALGDFGLQREDLERWFPEFISLRGTRIGELSGGEQRILECFIILRSPARFILLDEPFAGVDPLAVADIQEIVQYLKERGMGILITDHNVRETLQIVDRAYILNSGKILLEGDSQTIANSPVAKKFYLGDNFTL